MSLPPQLILPYWSCKVYNLLTCELTNGFVKFKGKNWIPESLNPMLQCLIITAMKHCQFWDMTLMEKPIGPAWAQDLPGNQFTMRKLHSCSTDHIMPPHKICVCIYINMNYICICKSIYMYIHIIYLQHPPVLNVCLLAKSTKFQPLKIKNTPGSFLEPEKCTWKIIPGSYPSSFIPSCDSNATTVGNCWCLLLASNQRLKSMHDMPVWDEQVARMVWKRANKAA